MDSSSSTIAFKDNELKWNEVLGALTNLSMTYVTIGDYIIIMNNKIDATICGEPYLALQLWFNIKSGKMISRIWDQTVAFGEIVGVAQLVEACITHFKGRPCIGCPALVDEGSGPEFVITHTPVLRRISRTCQQILNPNTNGSVSSCPECLKLRDFVVSEEMAECHKPFCLKRFTQLSQLKKHQKTSHNQSTDSSVKGHVEVHKKPAPGKPAWWPTSNSNVEPIGPEETLKGKWLREFNSEENFPFKFVSEMRVRCLSCETEFDAKQKSQLKKHANCKSHQDNTVLKEEGRVIREDSEINPRPKSDNGLAKDLCKMAVAANTGSTSAASASAHLSTSQPLSIFDSQQYNTKHIMISNESQDDSLEQSEKDSGPLQEVPFLKRFAKKRQKYEENRQDERKQRNECDQDRRAIILKKKVYNHNYRMGGFYLKCEVCGNTVRCKSFRAHMLSKHGMHGNFYTQCSWCEKQISTLHIQHHAMRTHFYGNFLCGKCPFSGSFADDLIDHISKDHGEDQYAKCPSCDKDNNLKYLESHYKICIVEKIEKQRGNRCNEMCPKCGKHFQKLKQYREHLKMHQRQEAPDEEKAAFYHFCDKCGKKFSNMSALNVHILSAHENHVYKCSLCPMTFSSIKKHSNHKVQAHSTNQRYQCKSCGVRKGSVSDLRSHERVHEDPKFQCSFCPKKLKSPEALIAHERSHTGEKSFKCSMCTNAFVSRRALLQHTRGVHKVVGSRGGKVGWSHKGDKKKTE